MELSETPLPSLPAQIGRYQVVRLLGQGAMGRVLLAHDPILDRAVAVKLLRDDLGIPPEQRQALIDRMRQEARASARVSHPNIVALHDMGEDPAAGLFLVFEYVEGQTLKEKLGRGPLGPEAAARLSRELGDALAMAHRSGVLHRDIKPENVILSRTGAKIADFGIARLPDSTLTRDGGLLGTPAYSAPESIAEGQFSPLSDQFSLGATLYEAIGGRRAFPGDDAVAVATKISIEEPPRIAEVCGVDTHVDTVLARALSKNPRSRFPGCDEFGRALAEALEMAPRTKMPTLPDQRHLDEQHGFSRATPLRIGIAGALLGALIVVGGFQLAEALRRPSSAADTVVTVAGSDATAAGTPALSAEGERRPRRVSAIGTTDSKPVQKRPFVDAGATSDAAAALKTSRADAGAAERTAAEAGAAPPPTDFVGRP